MLLTLIDIARLRYRKINRVVYKNIPILRRREVKNFSGSPPFLAGVFVAILLFPPDAAAGGIIYLSVGDISAAIAGERLGNITLFGKTVEGALAFAAATFTVLAVFSFSSILSLSIYGIAVGSVVCAFLELLPLKINDNFYLPVAGALILRFLG